MTANNIDAILDDIGGKLPGRQETKEYMERNLKDCENNGYAISDYELQLMAGSYWDGYRKAIEAK